ncbi:cupin domain-containing protein [Ferruginibacter profundus]
MKRKQFLATTLAAIPAIGFSNALLSKNSSKKSFTVKAGKGRFGESFLYKGKNPNDIKISKKDTGNQLAVFEYIGYEKSGPSLHLHFYQDEIFYVAEGNYRFVVGDSTQELQAGDTIFLPRNVPHTWLQLTDKGRLVYFVQPAGKMEDFFRTMNNLTHPPTEAEVKKIHLDNDMKIIGPPLSL